MNLYNIIPANNGKLALAGIVAFIAITLFCLTRCAHADTLDFGAGIGVAHGSGGAIDLTYHHPLPFAGSEAPQLFAGTLLHANDGIGDQSNWAWFVGLEGERGYFHAGIGAAYLQRIDSLNGAHTNYVLTMSYRRWKWCNITVTHFSDAGTTPVNTGRNILACEWEIR